MKKVSHFFILTFIIFSSSSWALEISNNIPRGTVGHWSVNVLTSGQSRQALLTAERFASGDIFTENVLFDYFSYVDTGIDGGGVQLFGSAPVRDPANPNVVSSSGSFTGVNGNIVDWTVISLIAPGKQVMTNRYTFVTRDGGPLGRLRFLQYLDEDVERVSDDVFFTKGSLVGGNLELFTMENREVYGVSQSGVFNTVSGLKNATFVGWAADVFDNIRPHITGSGQPVSERGVINNLSVFNHPQLGEVFGPEDIVSVLAWDINSSASTAEITTSLGGLPNLESAFRPPLVMAPGVRETVGEIRADRPTIVLTHGIQPGLTRDNVEPLALWTGFSGNDDNEEFPVFGAGHILRNLNVPDSIPGNRLGDEVNIIQYVWEEAYQDDGLTDVEYNTALSYADDAGVALAKVLIEKLGATYDRPIHFIGHSLGTVVNAYATRLFLNAAENVTLSQFTALDYPHRTRLKARSIPTNFFTSLLQELQNVRGLRIDNYHSPNTPAFGAETVGRIYDHPALDSPNDVGGEVFPDEPQGATFDHTGVHQWYRWTMDPEGFNNTNYCDDTNPDQFNAPLFISNTLDPCQEGWHWSLFGPGGPIFGDEDAFLSLPLGNPITITRAPLALNNPRDFGCTITGSTITCSEQSSPFIVFDVEISDDVDFLSFEYRFTNIGDGDYVAVLLDNTPIWILAGSNIIQQGVFFESGPIPIIEFIGKRKLTIALYGVGAPNAEFEIRNFSVISHLTEVPGDLDSDGDVDNNDLKTLLADRNKSVGQSACGVLCDLNSDGKIDALDVRKLQLLCTRPRCATQ